MTDRPRAATLAITTGFVSLATALGAALWWPVYEDAHFVLLVAETIALAVALAVVALVARWPGWALALGAIVLFLLAGVPLAVPARAVAGVLPTGDGLLALVSGLALGWKELLTITIPVGDYQALLVPVFALVLVSVVVGVRVGVRDRAGEWAVAGPVALAVAGILFGGGAAPWAAPVALALLAVCLAWLVVRRVARRTAALRALGGATRAGAGAARSLVGAAAILAVSAAASLGMTAVLPPDGDREVLREHVERPFDPRDHVSPLAGFRSYLRAENADEVLLRVSGLDAGERVRLAALDRYDGVVYTVASADDGSGSGTFVRVPTALDRGAGPRRVVDVEIAGYSGVWVPAVGLLESIDFRGDGAAALAEEFVANPDSGTAAVLGGLSTDDAYRISTVPIAGPELAGLAGATPGDAAVARVDVLPDGLSTLLDTWVGGEQEPGARLVAAIERLRATGYISHGLDADEPPSRSGHGADRISELVTAPRMIGDGEQYAVAAALMARQLGFPARVVVGFAPEVGGVDEVVEVRGADIAAWIEVNTAETGWVAIDPVPPERPIPEEDPEESTPISRPQSVVPPPSDDLPDQEEQATPESEREDPDAVDPVLAAFLTVARAVGVLALVVLVLLAPFLLIVAAKLRRRRLRRRSATPIERIRGGWDDFADSALDHGIVPPPAATRAEFAARVGVLPARVLAAAVDRATFAPERADDVEADHVWDAVDDLRLAFEHGASRRARLRALVSVRSFGGRSSTARSADRWRRRVARWWARLLGRLGGRRRDADATGSEAS